jgi:hypothetical protein
VDKESACLESWPRWQVDAKHSMLNKFRGPDDENFVAISTWIKAFALQADMDSYWRQIEDHESANGGPSTRLDNNIFKAREEPKTLAYRRSIPTQDIKGKANADNSLSPNTQRMTPLIQVTSDRSNSSASISRDGHGKKGKGKGRDPSQSIRSHLRREESESGTDDASDIEEPSINPYRRRRLQAQSAPESGNLKRDLTFIAIGAEMGASAVGLATSGKATANDVVSAATQSAWTTAQNTVSQPVGLGTPLPAAQELGLPTPRHIAPPLSRTLSASSLGSEMAQDFVAGIHHWVDTVTSAVPQDDPTRRELNPQSPDFELAHGSPDMVPAMTPPKEPPIYSSKVDKDYASYQKRWGDSWTNSHPMMRKRIAGSITSSSDTHSTFNTDNPSRSLDRILTAEIHRALAITQHVVELMLSEPGVIKKHEAHLTAALRSHASALNLLGRNVDNGIDDPALAFTLSALDSALKTNRQHIMAMARNTHDVAYNPDGSEELDSNTSLDKIMEHFESLRASGENTPSKNTERAFVSLISTMNDLVLLIRTIQMQKDHESNHGGRGALEFAKSMERTGMDPISLVSTSAALTRARADLMLMDRERTSQERNSLDTVRSLPGETLVGRIRTWFRRRADDREWARLKKRVMVSSEERNGFSVSD